VHIIQSKISEEIATLRLNMKMDDDHAKHEQKQLEDGAHQRMCDLSKCIEVASSKSRTKRPNESRPM
jgi:hypothetical protein